MGSLASKEDHPGELRSFASFREKNIASFNFFLHGIAANRDLKVTLANGAAKFP
jgi:hypothetical protein